MNAAAKLRSLLSTLGIVFGVVAVISMTSIGEGARREAIDQIKLLGTNNIRIKRLELTGERREKAERRFSQGLTYDDALLIQERIPVLHGVAPLKFVDAEVRFEGRQGVAQIIGTTPVYEEVTNFHVAEGRFITSFDLTDTKQICVLGSEVKQELFGYRDAFGTQIRIGEGLFTVVGVMESKVIREGRVAAIKVRNINKDVYIPITTAHRRFPWAGESSGIEEIAIRVALGGQRSGIIRMVVGEGLRLSLVGIGIGLLGTIALARVLRSLLFEVSPNDPVTLSSVVAFLGVVSIAACYVPARRAAQTDPVAALRRE